MVVLAVGAHPDDIEFGCFGTLNMLKDNGHEIAILIYSDGGRGGDPKVRVRETVESASMLEAGLKILEYKDGEIPLDPTIISRTYDIINEINPDMVFVMHPKDTHQDHRNVSRIILSSTRDVDKVLFYETPSSFNSFRPDISYNITGYFKEKVKALRCHESQAGRGYMDVEGIESCARFRGCQVYRSGELFESFQVHRWIESNKY